MDSLRGGARIESGWWDDVADHEDDPSLIQVLGDGVVVAGVELGESGYVDDYTDIADVGHCGCPGDF